MTALETALDFAARGWYVFPVQPGKKVPFPGFAWKEQSTNDPEKIRLAGTTQKYKGCNYALDTGKSGVLVVDFDVKKRSLVEARALLPSPLDSLFTVATPSGGLHLYFSSPGPTSASKIADGIDTRGVGGYVLIPGSVNGNGRPYKTLSDGPPPPAPRWLLDALGATTEKKPNAAIPLCELDQDHNVEAATRYLIEHAPEAIQGAGGDATTYEVACRVRDLGVSQDTTLALLAEHWNPVKAYPAWDVRDLEKKVQNAYRYAKDRPGNATPEALFPDPLRSEGAIRCAAEIDPSKIEDRPWILDCRYLPGYITLTVAPGGVGKSLLTILEGLSVASGKDLTHRAVRAQGPVWYHNTEDPVDELERRVAAAAMQHDLTGEDLNDFYFSSGYDAPLKLVKVDDHGRPQVNEAGVKALAGQLVKRGVKLFILDPLVGCHDAPENDNQAMELLMQAFRRIAQGAGCAVSLVHHVSKGKADYGNADRARGASAVVNAARIAHTVFPMDPDKAPKFGVTKEQAAWYVRLDNAKANLSPPGTSAEWYKKESVRLRFDAQDTTGALRAVVLDEVAAVDEKDVLLDAVARIMEPGGSESTYKLAEKIHLQGVIQGGYKTVQRKVETIFAQIVTHRGKVFSLSDAPRGKSLRCEKEAEL